MENSIRFGASSIAGGPMGRSTPAGVAGELALVAVKVLHSESTI